MYSVQFKINCMCLLFNKLSSRSLLKSKNIDGVVGPLTTPSVVEETVGTLQTSGGKLVEEEGPHVYIPTTHSLSLLHAPLLYIVCYVIVYF